MYSIFVIMNTFMKQFHKLPKWRRYATKQYSTVKSTASNLKTIVSYNEFIQQRQLEARKSIVVQVNSAKSFQELYSYCNNFGDIIGAHHYKVKSEEDQHYILLEYRTQKNAEAAINASSYNEDLVGVPVRSPFLWFKAAKGKSCALKSAKTRNKATNKSLSTENGTNMITNGELNNVLKLASSVEEQIHMLYRSTQLNDLGIRLRFLAALQLQESLTGMFPAANAQPFGSSVNGFGKMGCDLDLILRFDQELTGDYTIQRTDSRLVFHTKENLTNGRSQTQRQMESIGDVLHLFLPGICQVRRILQARVPIIKYHHEHLNLEVDLSMSNLTGFYMSELLYLFGELDDRVRPLIFCIRRWANTSGLTNPSPGRWITNFSLTCLVIFFLQQLKQPILPTINTLMKFAKSNDIRMTEDGINCSFVRDLERINFQTHNTSMIAELLLQFFEFYSQFDFNNRAISLNEGRNIAKPEHAALYIVNPFEQVLNVSKNVSLEECERLRIEVRNAAWILESEVESASAVDSENRKQDADAWGLLNLFKTPEKAIIRPNMFFKPRMVDVSDLFESSNNQITESSSFSTATQTDESEAINFKNSNVKQQVENIKIQARNDLKQMRLNAALSNSTASVSNSTQNPSKSKRSR